MEAGSLDRGEILRYLGYGSRGEGAADEAVLSMIADCERELFATADCKWALRETAVEVRQAGKTPSEEARRTGGQAGEDNGAAPLVITDCFETESRALAKNLAGCERVLLMAVTLGAGVDRLLARHGKLHMARAVVLQAAAAAMIEACCNELCAGWKKEYREKGLFLRPRFSPGYGDFPLACQEGILNVLDGGRRLGITLTDAFLMLPSKSVTAVIGISRNEEFCPVEGCEVCEKRDCLYRRQT